ncbi:hypothetical protein SOCE26_102910 [Sorangium cellulosum]|uniref:Uncharacterized protein n=1 Tax=Sorangium cellulosum TaxID=56 RepID=A0A2L0FAY6_SORCE|nr:hypothetical protein [Sorangium cellulosum]AUX48750.1 hypothetical protein SOCE26_102910 [Sorangium cellulosum]
MAMNEREQAAATVEGEVREIDEGVLKDLESKYTDVACPLHGGPPAFELAPDGSVVERFCCPALLAIVRELQVAAGERPAPAADDDEDEEGGS